MHPLERPRLKLARAEEHLNSLKVEIEGFRKTNPYSFVLQPDPKPPQYALCAKINKIPPKEWGCIIGDFAHNARSSLDLLVYQLSDLSAGDKGRRALGFPISDHPTDYRNAEDTYLCGVKPKYRTIIQRYQPYQRGQMEYINDPLGMLQCINNRDKHRLINVVGAIAKLDFFQFDKSSGLPDWIQFEDGAEIRISQSFDFGNGITGAKVGNGVISKDGAIVAKLTIPNPEQMKMNKETGITIQFAESDPRVKGRPVMDTLTFIYDRVKEIIGNFEQILPK